MTEGENSARRTARDRKQSRKEKIKVNIVRKVTGRDSVNSMLPILVGATTPGISLNAYCAALAVSCKPARLSDPLPSVRILRSASASEMERGLILSLDTKT